MAEGVVVNMPSEIQIGNTDAKLWFASGLLVVFAMLFAAWIRRRSISRFATRERIKPIFGSGSGKFFRSSARGVGLILAIVLLTFGLMDFRWGKIQREVPQEGVEVMFLLDVSRSMLAEDVTPNRLERAKQMIRDMIAAMAGDRVGLVVFAGETRRMIPLTNHYEDFSTALSDINPDSVRRGGSKLGNAIEVAGDGFLSKTNSQRVIVVLTDGEDQESQPASVAKKLKDENGIRIFTIGLGDIESGAKIPDAETQRYVRYQGEPVVTKLDGEILEQVAQVSGGAYVPAGTKQVDMKAVYDRYIAGMEKNDFDTAKIDAYEARFQWLAIPALVILLLEAWGITLPRRNPRLAVFAMMALLSSSGALADGATHLTEVYNQGVQSYRDGDLDSAIDYFDQAGRASNGELATSARYNAATARISQVQANIKEGKSESAKEQLQAAIDRLRLALRLRPRWQDARANLEIAVRLMDQLNQKEPEQPQGENEQKDDSKSPDESEKPNETNKPDQSDQQDQSGNSDQPDSNGTEQEESDPSESKDDSPNPPDQNDSSNDSTGEQTPGSEQQGEPDSSEQEEMDQQPNEPKTGELEADDENSNNQTAETGNSAELAESESMTEEEARKMLQSVRDRDMIRRFQQQQLRRSRQVPVDKDW